MKILYIQCRKLGNSLFELGESYFNELLNASMIQPIHDSSNDMIRSCRVHDMVLDLICSFSCEENFVTVLSDMGGTSPSNMNRRLSPLNGEENHMAQANGARSVVVFSTAISLVPSIDSCRVLLSRFRCP